MYCTRKFVNETKIRVMIGFALLILAGVLIGIERESREKLA